MAQELENSLRNIQYPTKSFNLNIKRRIHMMVKGVSQS